MPFLTLLRQLAADLNRQRLRTGLTILGITWGTTAVVVLLAFGVGVERQMKKNARGIGDHIAIVRGARTTVPFAGFGEGRRIRLSEADVEAVGRQVAGIDLIAPEYGRWTHVRRAEKGTNVYLTGVPPLYSELRNVFPQAGGRFVDPLDVRDRRRVAIIGAEVERLLFPEGGAIGAEIDVDGKPFRVIGITQPKRQNSSYQARDQDRVFIPHTTYGALWGDRFIERLIYRPESPELASAVSARVREVLGRRRGFDPADQDALSIWDIAENMKFFTYLFLGFNVFLGLVGTFTLVVGGIGVANVMYVVVQERTREIGIRRAHGAKRRDVLVQVLVEAFLLVGVGAVLGILISLGLVAAAGTLPLEEFLGVPVISPLVAGVTIALLAVVALLAGLMPARRAAALDPVECLRYGA